MAIGQLIRVSLYTKFGDQVGVNVLHYKQTSPDPTALAPAADYQSIADFISAAWAPLLRAAIAKTGSYIGAEVRYFAPLPVNDQAARSTAGAGLSTWATDNNAPTQVSGLVRKSTAFATRSGRGRMYIPFVPADAVNAVGTPTAAYLLVLQDIADELILSQAPFVSEGAAQFIPQLVQYTAGGRPLTSREVVASNVASKFATQRRRGAFGRPNAAPF